MVDVVFMINILGGCFGLVAIIVSCFALFLALKALIKIEAAEKSKLSIVTGYAESDIPSYQAAFGLPTEMDPEAPPKPSNRDVPPPQYADLSSVMEDVTLDEII